MRREKHSIGMFMCCILVGAAALLALSGCAVEVKEVDYEQLKSWIENGEEMVLIDVRPATGYDAGHLQNAINIPLGTFANQDGSLINDGAALTTVVTDRNKKIVAYCAGFGNDGIFANAAIGLGYTDVYRYTAGTADWSANGDYYVIEYAGFKAWHDAKYPFEEGEHYLIDDLPVAWYTGDDPSHPGGHIPCAVNIPVEQWVGSDGSLVNGGAAFTDFVTNQDAMVVIYCGDALCGKSLAGARAAVKMGYTHVYRYQGGQKEWMEKGNALTPGDQPCPE